MNKKDVLIQLTKTLNFRDSDLEKLDIFHDELLKYNKKFNLISSSTEQDIWNRHILDSAQLVKFIDFDDNKTLSDMGPGAGFPGVIIALFNNNPKFHVKLYEKSNVKCDFLEIVKSKLNLQYQVFGDYKDEYIKSEYVVSRAFKKLEEILRISREIIEFNHKLIILKGKNAKNEINNLQVPLDFVYKLESSMTDIESKILIVDIKK